MNDHCDCENILAAVWCDVCDAYNNVNVILLIYLYPAVSNNEHDITISIANEHDYFQYRPILDFLLHQ